MVVSNRARCPASALFTELPPIDGRTVGRCEQCKLVQFKPRQGKCRKCGVELRGPSFGNIPVSGETPLERIPYAVRTLMMLQDVNVVQVTRGMGKTRGWIAAVITGTLVPSVSEMERLAHVFDTRPSAVLEIAERGSLDSPVLPSRIESPRRIVKYIPHALRILRARHGFSIAEIAIRAFGSASRIPDVLSCETNQVDSLSILLRYAFALGLAGSVIIKTAEEKVLEQLSPL